MSQSIKWHVVELWNVPAEQLFLTGDVGLIPWAMLADSAESPTVLTQRCRDAIDRSALPGERENLLAVVQVLARLRDDDPSVFAILGGQKTMIESPLIDEIVSEAVSRAESRTRHNDILEFLSARFGGISAELETQIRSELDSQALTRMTRQAAAYADLAAFQQSLT